MARPVLEEIVAERPDLKVSKINIDEGAELAGCFGMDEHSHAHCNEKRKNRESSGEHAHSGEDLLEAAPRVFGISPSMNCSSG